MRPIAVDPQHMTGAEVVAELTAHGLRGEVVETDHGPVVRVPVDVTVFGDPQVQVDDLPVGGSLSGLRDWLGY
jgi:hypothetical protein